VRLRLPPDQLELLGDLKLKPGMPAEVFIQTRARSPMSYLLQPLSDQIARSFRES
jgi:HlyD family secretion protein